MIWWSKPVLPSNYCTHLYFFSTATRTAVLLCELSSFVRQSYIVGVSLLASHRNFYLEATLITIFARPLSSQVNLSSQLRGIWCSDLPSNFRPASFESWTHIVQGILTTLSTKSCWVRSTRRSIARRCNLCADNKKVLWRRCLPVRCPWRRRKPMHAKDGIAYSANAWYRPHRSDRLRRPGD